jgi:hypothetical protein
MVGGDGLTEQTEGSTYYYSLTRLQVDVHIEIEGEAIDVQGIGWQEIILFKEVPLYTWHFWEGGTVVLREDRWVAGLRDRLCRTRAPHPGPGLMHPGQRWTVPWWLGARKSISCLTSDEGSYGNIAVPTLDSFAFSSTIARSGEKGSRQAD